MIGAVPVFFALLSWFLILTGVATAIPLASLPIATAIKRVRDARDRD